MMDLRTLMAIAMISQLAACKVGPNFKSPSEPTPDHYAGVAAPISGAPRTEVDSNVSSFWWQEFHDQELNSLEQRAVAGNLDLKAAYLRIVEARMQVQSARAQGLPSLNASASFNREQLGLAGILKQEQVPASVTSSPQVQGLIGALESPVNIYQLGFDASWELDLFGKVRRSVEAADAQATSTVEARNDMLVSLEAEVAQDYLQLRAAQALTRVTRAEIADQKDAANLTQNRHEHGLAGEPDVDAARAQLASLQSQLPSYEQTIVSSRHALAVLTGQTPESIDEEFGKDGDLPLMPAVVPVGIPSQLARRRPDIRASEATLHAATAQEGVAVASLFPDFSLSGTLGLRNLGTGYLFDWASHFYTFGPSVSMPIFHGGALVANVRMTKAQAAEAALNYRKAVLTALQEVEDGLDSLQQDAQRVESLKEAVGADRRAVEVDTDAYRHGLMTYINVLTLQLQVQQGEQQLSQALLTQSTDLVKLYKALGGGWQKSQDDQDGKIAGNPEAKLPIEAASIP